MTCGQSFCVSSADPASVFASNIYWPFETRNPLFHFFLNVDQAASSSAYMSNQINISDGHKKTLTPHTHGGQRAPLGDVCAGVHERPDVHVCGHDCCPHHDGACVHVSEHVHGCVHAPQHEHAWQHAAKQGG